MPFKLRLETARSKLLGSRRGSAASVTSSAGSTGPAAVPEKARSVSAVSLHHPRSRSAATADVPSLPAARSTRRRPSETIADRSDGSTSKDLPHPPVLALHQPSPDINLDADADADADEAHPLPTPDALSPKARPPAVRRQSLIDNSNARVIKTLLDPASARPSAAAHDDHADSDPLALGASMLHRKIWVKRPGASATLVQISEDDLVDDVRDMILRKYANSLGRSYDSPDVTLRIVPRDAAQRHNDRTLGPEEDMCRTLDAYYPDGQTVDEALLIDVPQRRTPKPSPRAPLPPHVVQYFEDHRPVENGTDYFPPMPALGVPSPASLTSLSHESRQSHAAQERSIAVLSSGQVPPLPSPGASRRTYSHRPKYQRHPTSSPTQIVHPPASAAASQHLPPRPAGRQRLDSSASDTKHPAIPNAPPLPTPPAPEAPPTNQKSSTPPTPRVQSPDPRKPKRRRNKPDNIELPNLPSGLLDGSVPPINVLIVEDNIINLKLLEAFMKRLKVRWQTAMNGRDAVTKWRTGGFHLVLMDIQLPIMSGLEATKEIRRLERVNNIGVFSNSSASSTAPVLHKGRAETNDEGSREVKEDDKLGSGILFKSPVIIVALTASSLQSDRHEALAVGCNDFLTKPVNFVWLERKVKEWGCMQALIDYDGWRKWKTFTDETAAEVNKIKTKKKANRTSLSKALAVSPSPVSEQQALAQAVQAPATALIDGAVDGVLETDTASG